MKMFIVTPDRAAASPPVGLLERLAHGRPVEEDVLAFEVGGRLAVGDQQHLLGGVPLLGERSPGQVEGVLHVGAVHRLPVDLGEIARSHRPGVVAEPDDLEMVLGIGGGDERVERQRHPLGGKPVPAQRHRPGHVEQEHGGGAGAVLGFGDLEVVGVEPDHLVEGPDRSTAL
jgi:hypothetical protein